MSAVLDTLTGWYGEGPEALRLTGEGLWHATPVAVLAAAVEWMAFTPGAVVLDAGCGDGRLLAALALSGRARDVTLLGLECDAPLVERAQQVLSRLPAPGRPRVAVGDYFSDAAYAVLGISVSDVTVWCNYPDGNEARLLQHVLARGVAGARLLVLSPESEPWLGAPPKSRRTVVPSGNALPWTLSVYAR